jgi:hypothetical protein
MCTPILLTKLRRKGYAVASMPSTTQETVNTSDICTTVHSPQHLQPPAFRPASSSDAATAVTAAAAAAADADGALLLQVKDGAFLSPDAWQALGGSASALLSASITLIYIGPVFALLGYAIKQWSTCQEVPQEAVDLLQSCRDLLFDLNQAWPHTMPQQQQQQQQRERLQRCLRLVAQAAAECMVINSKGLIMR